MKKLFATISVLIYFAFTCGVIVNMHYCMNSFDSIRFYQAKSDYCTKCGMHTKSHGCCHDEVSIVKIDDDQQASHFNFTANAPSPAIVVYTEYILKGLFNAKQASDYLNHSPPLLTEQDTYLQNCVFRI